MSLLRGVEDEKTNTNVASRVRSGNDSSLLQLLTGLWTRPSARWLSNVILARLIVESEQPISISKRIIVASHQRPQLRDDIRGGYVLDTLLFPL